ncbi:MAG: outer membrane beta-barrel domain-containing protein [Myxococcales bacterium]|jgi:outer membrane beta-barrel protein|nr:outer membrane beta-barrel domain-containing protein [Myxococcales bacterium]
MKRTRIELSLLFIGLILIPAAAMADEDDMTFDEDEVDSSLVDDAADGGVMSSEGGSDDILGGDILAGLDDDFGEEAEPEDTDGKGKGKGKAAASKETDLVKRHPIWAVQQVYALRKGRVDFQPMFGFSLNDPYVQHQSLTLTADYYITEVIGVGVSFNWYRFLENETDLNYQISRATHQTVPINSYFWGVQANFTYVPMYGKFAFLKNWILHWDVWLVGGAGVISTRPIPVIDPEYRDFDYGVKFSFNVGIGGRLYLTRFLAIALELRDYIYPEEIESIVTYSSDEMRSQKDRWTDPNRKLTNNVMLQLGVSLFLPFTFEYKLPK